MIEGLNVKRTGNVFSVASTEYLVTFPDGTTQNIWSPPWHEMDEEEEDTAALEYARTLWIERTMHVSTI